MSKKYLSLEEAAVALGMSVDELKRLREKGEIRGFADRATWKFRDQDVEEFRRRRNPDSAPEVPIMGDDDSIGIGDEELISNDSASDVRLILDDDLLAGNDSTPDVPALGSGVLLSGSGLLGSGSDSDVKLVNDPSSPGSDSDVRLIDHADDEMASNVLADDEPVRDRDGLTLAAGSSILGGDSGISLEAADSGISLEAADSGISLESLDSSISLSHDSDADFAMEEDSGISLSDDDSNKTVSMDLGAEQDLDDTRFELETAGSSEYEISGLGDDDDQDDTSVLLLDDEDESSAASATMVGKGRKQAEPEEETFDLGDDEGDFDEFEMAEETVAGDDDELDELDVFDAVDEDFEDDFADAGSAGEFAAPVGMRVPAAVEPEWGTGTFVGVLISSILMAICGLMMIDLVRGMWSYQQPASYTSPLLDIFKGMMQ